MRSSQGYLGFAGPRVSGSRRRLCSSAAGLLHRPSYSFFFRSSHFFSVITWVWPLRWTPAYSVADGEASTGSFVAGDLPRAVECVFQVRLALSGFLLTCGVHCLLPETGRRRLFRSSEESPEFHFLRFSFQKWMPEVILGQVCCFLIFWSCWLGFYLVNGLCFLVSLL